MSEKPAALNRNLARAAVVVWAEAAVVGAFALFLLWGLAAGSGERIAADLSLVALYGAAAAWLVYMGRALRQGKRWARSAAIFWQTCQLFLAAQSFTGRSASWLIGGYLVLSAALVLFWLFSKPVLADSKREIEEGR